MPDVPGDFRTRLLATFRVEAEEHLLAMMNALVEMESGDARAELVEQIFRDAHSLKGAARAVNLGEVEAVCHALESLFSDVKRNRTAPDRALFDAIHEALDALTALLGERPANAKALVAPVLRKLEDAASGRAPAADAANPVMVARREADAPSRAPASGTIRVRTEKLDAMLRQSEELLGPRLALAQRLLDVRDLRAMAAARRQKCELAAAARHRLEHALPADGRREVVQLLEHVQSEGAFLKALESGLAQLERTSDADQRALGGIVDALLREVKEAHLLPFSSLFETLPLVVRELARSQGKQVELVLRGAGIEIDRRILDELRDPLTHLLRNAAGHGIETPDVRVAAGKPPQGTITIAVSQSGGKVAIELADDGRGIDRAALRAAAERLGIVAPDAVLDDRETLALMFQSGLSTSDTVSELSGRGLGLAIVQEKIQRLGGTISVSSEPGRGASMRIALPLMLATFRGVLVRAANRSFVIPSASVERVARVVESDIRTVENRQTVPLDGRATSLVALADALELPRSAAQRNAAAPGDAGQMVIVRAGVDRIAFRVDAVLSEQEVVVKWAGPQLVRVRNLAGATVLGDGELVPVLNVSDLVASAVQARAPQPEVAVAPAPARPASILVVEDSITSRTLLENILEAAGYDVTTAVDGVDGYTTLKSAPFDLVVSDVEMPRMDGFDLVRKIRADKELERLPVVLITALASREHRERGIDAGANAYIVKSSFDQSDLLETIRRFV